MRPVVRAAVAVAGLSAISAWSYRFSVPRHITVVTTIDNHDGSPLSSLCPAGFLPDSTQCVPFPPMGDENQQPGLSKGVNTPRDPSGTWKIYEQIPRRPDRPAPYEAYRFPFDPRLPILVLRGYDETRLDTEKPSGQDLSTKNRLGIDLDVPRGTPVYALQLPFQQGNAEVVFVGILFGKTVATRHTLLESGKNRDYLLIYGHLDQTATGLAPGAEAAAGTWLGTVGDSGSEGRVHLFLEVRQVRENTEHSLLLSSALVDFTVSIACDPRNVLPFADSPASPAPP
ncbi:MAG: hypothetical protein BWY17_00182 [Deltaproteobacteria bacterium ADurb.Bin207]|nr:MAG: hypothetical protein BWY17_00182 [Deltaproteobacteria bacterium ADurb.Bin207]